MRSILKKLLSPILKKANEIYISKPRKYSYKNVSVVVVPTVFPPFLTISTKLLLKFIETQTLKDKRFLELGCGCGIISILAAKKGAVVTASDINQTAIDALLENALNNEVSVDAIFSDLFKNLKEKRFDIIIINPPYYPKNPTTIAESAWYCGSDFEYFVKLFSQLPSHMTLHTDVFMILSEDCELDKITEFAKSHKIRFQMQTTHKVAGEQNYIFKLLFAG